MDPSDRRQEQRHGVLCDRIRRVCRHSNDMDLAVRIFDVDVVVARAPKRDQADVHLHEFIDDFAVHVIVNEYTHNIAPFSQAAGVFGQTRLIENYLISVIAVRPDKRILVVILGIEKSYLHAINPPLYMIDKRLYTGIIIE